MPFPLTFDEWRATGRDVDDLAAGRNFQCNDDDCGQPGRVYGNNRDTRGWIRRQPDNRYPWRLEIIDSVAESDDLRWLELILYKFLSEECGV